MNSKIRLWMISGFCLAIVMCFFTAHSSLDAQEKTTKYTKSDLQDLYVSFLKKEGYLPSIDQDGDVQFKFEGRTYFFAVNEGDAQFFRLVHAGFWPIENEAERTQVLIAANHSTSKTKCAKVFMVKDNVWASIEMFVESPENFRPLFKRSISALQMGVKTFGNKMRE